MEAQKVVVRQGGKAIFLFPKIFPANAGIGCRGFAPAPPERKETTEFQRSE
jgi:hypothetical protein